MLYKDSQLTNTENIIYEKLKVQKQITSLDQLTPLNINEYNNDYYKKQVLF